MYLCLIITGEVWNLACTTQLTTHKEKTLEKEYVEETCIAEEGERYCKVTEIDGPNPQCTYDRDRFGCGSSIEKFNETDGILCID